MKPFDPHRKSQQLRRFKPTRKPAGVFSIAVAFCDASLLALAFFLLVSDFVMQPGINIQLPTTTAFSGGARFGSMVLSITRGGWYYFADQRLAPSDLPPALESAARSHPGSPLIIEADSSVALRHVVDAWNAAADAGVRDVTIATRVSAIEGPPLEEAR